MTKHFIYLDQLPPLEPEDRWFGVPKHFTYLDQFAVLEPGDGWFGEPKHFPFNHQLLILHQVLGLLKRNHCGRSCFRQMPYTKTNQNLNSPITRKYNILRSKRKEEDRYLMFYAWSTARGDETKHVYHK